MAVLKINGQMRQFADDKLPGTVAELLEQLGVEPATVVAEVDGRIVERVGFATTRLCDEQSIELVRFVPGG